MKTSKVSIGPISKEVVDVAIQYAEDRSCKVTLIPSRRQVDAMGGYVGFTTKSLSEYCRHHSKNILIQRDHGGPLQGELPDVGFDSFYWDAKYFDSIHIDPFRLRSFTSGVEASAKFIDFCKKVNPLVKFEVGTEESICPYQPFELGVLLGHLKRKVTDVAWNDIVTVCIQSGTALMDGINVGSYKKDRLFDMLSMCKHFGKKSKEHNGDYLLDPVIQEKFRLGLDFINIAPEWGQMQTSIYISRMNDHQFDEWFKICFESGKWKKWVHDGFSPFESETARRQTVMLAGHYTFNLPIFQPLKRQIEGVEEVLKYKMYDRLDEINGEV